MSLLGAQWKRIKKEGLRLKALLRRPNTVRKEGKSVRKNERFN